MMAKGIIIATSFGQRSGRPENKVSRSAFLLPTEQESRKGVLSGTVTLYAADIAAQKVEETILSKTADFIRSRKGATILLAAATLVGSIFISSNLSAVKVTDGSEKQTVVTGKTADTMQIIDQAGFALSDNDAYSVDGADSAVKAIKIFRAFDIKVIDGGKEKTISAVSGTVGEALANAGIDLPDEDDVMSVTLDADAEEDMTVRIDRVKVVKSTATKTVSYKTVTKNDSSLESGKTKVSVEGVNGTKEVTTTKKYVNGKLTETKTTEKVIKKAVDKVILKGTKKAAAKTTAPKKTTAANNAKASVDAGKKTLTINGKTVSYSRVLTGSGTAYTAPKGSLTSTGKKVRVGLVAVNPKVIPYGTRLYITTADGSRTYGYAVAADTGGALRSGAALVDLFYNTESECRSFGRRQVKVYILD